MKKLFKKSLAVVLAVVLTLTAAPLGGFVGLELPSLFDFKAEAAETYSGTCGDKLTWTLNTTTGVLNIMGTGDMDDFNYDPPWSSYNSYIKTVIIADQITSITYGAFFECYEIQYLRYPLIDNVDDFYYGRSASKITIANGEVVIEWTEGDQTTELMLGADFASINLFDPLLYVCGLVESIALDKANTSFKLIDGVLYDKDIKNLLIYPTASSKTEYIMPDTVEGGYHSVLEAYQFSLVGAQNLKSLTYGASFGKNIVQTLFNAFDEEYNDAASNSERIGVLVIIARNASLYFFGEGVYGYYGNRLEQFAVSANNPYLKNKNGMLVIPYDGYDIIVEQMVKHIDRYELGSKDIISPTYSFKFAEIGEMVISDAFADNYYKAIDCVRDREHNEILIALSSFFCEGMKIGSFAVEDTNKYFSVKNGVLYSKDGRGLLAYPMDSESNLFVYPNVDYSSPYAFTYLGGAVSIRKDGFVVHINEDSGPLAESLLCVEEICFSDETVANYNCSEYFGVDNFEEIKDEIELYNEQWEELIEYYDIAYESGEISEYQYSYIINYLQAAGVKLSNLKICNNIHKSKYTVAIREFDKNFDDYAADLDSSVYDPKLANIMAAFSQAVYSEDEIEAACRSFGFTDYGTFDYNTEYNPHTCGYSLAFKKSDYSDDIICLVSVRGSQKLDYNADWIGNFMIMTEETKHKGFADPANRIYEAIQNETKNLTGNIKYFITGHSRGAAVANLLSVKLMENGVSSSNIYNYNFACPDVACRVSFTEYDNIFNLCNREDVVPYIPGNIASTLTSPGTSWGKFGKTYWFTKDAPDTINPFADHAMDLYLEFFDQQLAPSAWGETFEDKWDDATHIISGWIAKIMCPVDVIITDENGNNIASVIGGEVDYYNSQVGDVLIFTDGDKKVIYINGDNDFNVNLIGTDSGEMTYSVEKYNVQSEEVLESKTFSNVKLEEGKRMFSPVSNADNADEVALFVTETQNGQQVITHTISTSGTETAVENETPSAPTQPDDPVNPDNPTDPWEDSTPVINLPSRTTVNYGETLVLTIGEIEIPEGYAIAWFVEGAGVSTWVSEDGLECRVTSIANGNATIYAKLVDEEEIPVTNADGEEIFDEITLVSKAGFWQKFISFFKNLFGISRIIY